MSRADGRKPNTDVSGEGMVLLYLTACALNDSVPDIGQLSEEEAEKIFKGAMRHSIISPVACALEKGGYAGIPGEAADKFKKARYKAIRKTLLLDAERENILAYMEEEGIRYMPLKGVFLQDLYPEPGMRQMTDNDILYDVSCRAKLRKYMEGIGFTCKKDMGGVHDAYFMEPVYNYEMHGRLFTEAAGNGVYDAYYKDIWDRAVPDEDKKYGYHLSDADFYVYMTAHAEKHYSGPGTGIRTLADFYVMNRIFRRMDRDYVDGELKKLGLSDFEERIRVLAFKILGEDGNKESLTPDEEWMLERLLASGTYGNTETKVTALMKKRGIEGRLTAGKRMTYLFRRLFPDQKTLAPFYPAARFKVLIPVVWAFRIVRGLATKQGDIKSEIAVVRRRKKV
ncbi:MAG: nucleotidyltransferase family protein [Lachnospiraceae bacterium]|nr:nucleotidyltransferase family protein [Lachnospiraceae bacterium]